MRALSTHEKKKHTKQISLILVQNLSYPQQQQQKKKHSNYKINRKNNNKVLIWIWRRRQIHARRAHNTNNQNKLSSIKKLNKAAEVWTWPVFSTFIWNGTGIDIETRKRKRIKTFDEHMEHVITMIFVLVLSYDSSTSYIWHMGAHPVIVEDLCTENLIFKKKNSSNCCIFYLILRVKGSFFMAKLSIKSLLGIFSAFWASENRKIVM